MTLKRAKGACRRLEALVDLILLGDAFQRFALDGTDDVGVV
eukprot:CAMPEP_0194060214 /NCGR_PEP_ID=MMETSP0009_2-20130614/71199_1 /TAXON_ID=210454 /ORGANISM="Grammatophora oceanica, Strain CCMP 410" /LENGTH=40 /DNA_ID= /DNA_START= /DNA_END= /DNA_ORIENTATION=